MLIIDLSSKCLSEKKYVAQVVFSEFLGIDYQLRIAETDDVCIALPNGKKLQIEDHFFKGFPDGLDLEYLKVPELISWARNNFLQEQDIPVIFGCGEIEIGADKIRCGIDLFSSIFFMLSRWEEVVCKVRDLHERFPAKASLAWKSKFLYRPVVDEYVEMLWKMLYFLDPSLRRKIQVGGVVVTCDVDAPFDPGVKNVLRLLKSFAGDLMRRNSLFLAFKRLANFFLFRMGCFSLDLNYSFHWYLDALEKNGLKGVFYFIPDNSEPKNGVYELNEIEIRDLLRLIHSRGHEIGVHGSYHSFKNGEKISQEKQRLEDTLKKLGCEQKIRGNRQHYLRWDALLTPDLLDSAGYEYDSSGGYADVPGFRFGTAKEFHMWSLKKRTPLGLIQRPLIFMDTTILSNKYLGFGFNENAKKLIYKLKSASIKTGGNFILLWHNSNLFGNDARSFFLSAFEKIS